MRLAATVKLTFFGVMPFAMISEWGECSKTGIA